MRGYHWREGWYFNREPNGDVSLKKDSSHPSGALPFVDATITANEWASIVASLSKSGESGETYRAALALHNGEKLTPAGRAALEAADGEEK